MKRTLVWSSLGLALASGCGDDTQVATDATDSMGTSGDDGAGPTTDGGPGVDASTDGESTGDGSTSGGPDTMGSSSTTDSSGDAGSSGSDEGTETGDTTGGDTSPMGVLDHIGGGRPGAVAIAGSHAYIAMGPTVMVWDITAIDAPTLVGAAPTLPGLVSGIAVHGSHAYVSATRDLEGEVHILDIADPTSPIHVGTVDYTANAFRVPNAVATDGSVLFVADSEVGIVALDLSADPEAPAIVDTLEVFGVEDVSVASGSMRYRSGGFLGGDSVGTVTHTDGVMVETGFASLPDPGMDAAFDGDYVYNTGQFGFFGYDFTDPDVPTTSFSATNVTGTSVQGASGVAYNFGNRLGVFDFTSPTPSQVLTVLSPTGRTSASTIAGTVLLGASEQGRGLFFDITAPLAPTEASVFDLPVGASPSAVGFGKSGLVVSNFYTGLRVVDPADHTTIGRFDVEAPQVGVEDLRVVGDLAYLADWSAGLHIVDVSNGASPVLVATLATPGAPSAVDVAGSHVYLGEGTGAGAVQVIDVSDPAQPTIVGSIATTKVRDLVVDGDFVYVADEEVFAIGGLRIIDVSDPTAPVQTAHYTTCASALGVDVLGTRAYVACAGDDMLHIVDVSDPSAPVHEHSVGVGGSGVASVAVDATRAWVGYGMGMSEIDIEDPDDPQLLYDYATAMQVSDIQLREESVFAISGMGGIYRVTLE